MNNTANRVLVFGDDCRSFLAIVRSLGRKGIEVHAVPFNKSASALKSRYIRMVHELPAYDGSGGWIAALQRILKEYQYDLILPCSDQAILCLDAHREALTHVRIAMPNSCAMEMLFDKHKTRALAAELEIPIPRGGVVKRTDTAEELANEFGLPLMVKMRQSFHLKRLEERGPVYEVSSVKKLKKILHGITPEYNLVEAHVAGTGVGVSFLASDGEILCAFQHRRLKEPVGGGSSSLRISERLDERLLLACKAMVAHCKFTGVAMFEFRVDGNGSFALIDVNARFWGSLPLAIASGVNFPWLLYILEVHGKRSEQVNYPAGIVARNFVLNAYDVFFRNGLTRKGGVRRTFSDIIGLMGHPFRLLLKQEVSDTFQGDDLKPAIAEFVTALSRALQRWIFNRRKSRHRSSSDRAGLWTSESFEPRQ